MPGCGTSAPASDAGGSRAVIYDIVHVNINVTDLTRSRSFYETLGFRVIHDFGEPKPGEPGVRGVVMALSDHPRAFTKLELLEHVEPRTEPDRARGAHEVGLARLALRCKNLEAFVAQLCEKGLSFEPIRKTDVVGARAYVFFRDPDGTLLELIEFA